MRTLSRRLIPVILLLGFLPVSGCGKNNSGEPPASPTSQILSKEVGQTIELKDNENPNPLLCDLKRHSAPELDHCRWVNRTTTDRVIHFKSDWPFMEGREDIKVPANGGYSAWFSLDHNTTAKAYPYEVQPSLFASTPPDEPSISVGE